MDFSDKELKVLLQALYRFRGEVSGASQSEQNKFGLVVSVIDKIEDKVGPLKAERTGFDREMDESLSILNTGRMGLAKSAKAKDELDKAADAPKVKKGAVKAKAAAVPKAKKAAGATKKTPASKAGGGKSGTPKK
jgi:hypothetical protein